MRNLFRLWICVLALYPTAAATAQEPSVTGAALRAIFNVERAPQAKSMGLFQANFLDALPPTHNALQLAVVVDATESMSHELDSIRKTLPQMFADLARIHDGAMASTVVTYSDTGASDRPARVLHQAFVHDPEQLTTLVSEIEPESGRPYFPESVDLGVFTAVEELDWSADDQVEKWILLIGDAPPYDPQYTDPETKARRWYDTNFLVDLATKKNLKIHCLLCPSREDEKRAYEESLAKSRQFMSRLADGTGGRMLDLSYPLVRQQLLESAKQPESNYTRIGYITTAEIAALRPAAPTAPQAESLRVAILPYLPWESMNFFYDRPAVQLATEIRQALRQSPAIQTVAPRQIEDELTRLQGEGLPAEQWPQALCWRLRCDFLLTGELRIADGQAFAATQVFGRDEPQRLLQLATEGPVETLAAAILRDLQTVNPRPAALEPLAANLSQAVAGIASATDATGQLGSLDESQRGRLLGAFEALEQALGYPLGDPQGAELLSAAVEQLSAFLQQQPEHAFAHVLMASAAYNLAKLHERGGDSEQARFHQQQALSSLKEAFRLRTQLVDRLTRLEVQADHALMVTRDIEEAVRLYEEILQFSEASPLRPALRAHWMLMAINLGAWQIDATHPNLVQPERAREHLLRILAFWPSSSEAAAVKRFILWDEKTARSRTPYLPVDSQPLAVAESAGN